MRRKRADAGRVGADGITAHESDHNSPFQQSPNPSGLVHVDFGAAKDGHGAGHGVVADGVVRGVVHKERLHTDVAIFTRKAVLLRHRLLQGQQDLDQRPLLGLIIGIATNLGLGWGKADKM